MLRFVENNRPSRQYFIPMQRIHIFVSVSLQERPPGRLLPVTGSKIDRLASSHICHNVLNVPWLVTVARRVVGRNTLIVLVSDTLLHAINDIVVIGVHVVLGIVAPDPLGQLGSSQTGVELDLCPVRVLEELCVTEAKLLCARVADETITRLEKKNSHKRRI
jgi:hypothetical protein